MAEYLAVHEIADAYQPPDESYRHSEAVECPQRAAARHKTAVEQHSYDDADGAAMAGEAAFPCGQNLERMLRVIIPLVEEHMAQTGTHDGGNGHIDEQRAHPLLGRSLAAIHTGHHIEAYPEADGEHKPVPAHSHRPGYNLGTDIPYNIIEHFGYDFDFEKYSRVARRTWPLRANTVVMVAKAMSA